MARIILDTTATAAYGWLADNSEDEILRALSVVGGDGVVFAAEPTGTLMDEISRPRQSRRQDAFLSRAAAPSTAR